MRKAIVVVAAAIMVLGGIALVTARTHTHSTVPPVPASMSTLDLMSNAKDLPVAPHPDAF